MTVLKLKIEMDINNESKKSGSGSGDEYKIPHHPLYLLVSVLQYLSKSNNMIKFPLTVFSLLLCMLIHGQATPGEVRIAIAKSITDLKVTP